MGAASALLQKETLLHAFSRKHSRLLHVCSVEMSLSLLRSHLRSLHGMGDGNTGCGPWAPAEATVRQRHLLVLLTQKGYYFIAVWSSNISFGEILGWNDAFVSMQNGMGSREIRTVLSYVDLPLWTTTALGTRLAYGRCRFRIEQYREL